MILGSQLIRVHSRYSRASISLTQILIERANLPRLGPNPRDAEHDENCADAASHDGDYRAERRGRQTGLERTEFVGSADEDIIHGGNSAAHRVGRDELKQG